MYEAKKLDKGNVTTKTSDNLYNYLILYKMYGMINVIFFAG
jgi:hypothetical protein